MTEQKAANSVYRYDFILWIKDGHCASTLANALKDIAKKWVFQTERGKQSGKLHYQGRISLHKKLRKSELLKLVKDTVLEEASFRHTSNACKTFDYVMKKDTRVEGPWKDSDASIEDEPVEIKGKVPLKWQQDCINWIKENDDDDRVVNVVVDFKGGCGKGFVRKYTRYHKLALSPPDCSERKHMMAYVLDNPSPCYIFDIPRARGKPKLREELWIGIESIKDGRAYDSRYKSRDVQRSKSPMVWVFTNELPDLTLLSSDRWNLLLISKEGLIPYSKENMERIKDDNIFTEPKSRKRRIGEAISVPTESEAIRHCSSSGSVGSSGCIDTMGQSDEVSLASSRGLTPPKSDDEPLEAAVSPRLERAIDELAELAEATGFSLQLM